jgi:cytochrome c oxidase subunit 4
VTHTQTQTHSPDETEREELQHHPDAKAYVNIALVLVAVTMAEVAVYYMNFAHNMLVPVLIGFSAVKFILVVRWFMHLKFDAPQYTRMFVMGLLIAAIVYTVVLVIFGAFTK